MQLYLWRGAATNFGDELNALLWPRLLPGFFDDDASELFLGIGSVLDDRHDRRAMKLVAGAGYGGYQPLPALDATWIIHWVRGPRTARLLGLQPALGMGDPAMLLPRSPVGPAGSTGFMPHFESLARGWWREAAAAAGLSLIDPRQDPQDVIAAIAGCRLLVSEAMHGAVVADAMRVPWIALSPLAPVHRAKWQDWADVLGLTVRFQPLAASSFAEWLQGSPFAACNAGRRLLERADPLLARLARRRFVERAAEALATAAAASAQLSAETALERCRSRMLECLETLRRDPWRRSASALHSRTNSA